MSPVRKTRIEVETLGEGECHILRVGRDHVAFRECDREVIIRALEKAKPRAMAPASRRRNGLRAVR